MADMGNIHKEITIPNRIFIKGFPASTSEEDLETIFTEYGSIIETKIIRDAISGQNKGFGFITFDSQHVAENVIATCKSVDIDGTEATVGPAKIRRRPPQTKYYRPSYYPAPGLPPHPRLVSVPYSVSPDGLFTFHQHPFVPHPLGPPPASFCYPGGEGGPIPVELTEGYPPNGTLMHGDTYMPNQDPCIIASKPCKALLPLIDGINQFDMNEPKKTGSPPLREASPPDFRTFAAAGVQHMGDNRKAIPVHNFLNGGNQQASVQTSVVNSHFISMRNGPQHPLDMKSMATTSIHLPSLPGHTSFETHPHLNGNGPHNNGDVTWNMAMIPNHCIPVATIISQSEPINQSEPGNHGNQPGGGHGNYMNNKAEPRKIYTSVPTSLPARSVPSNRVANGNMGKMNGGQESGMNISCSASLKGHQFVFMATGPSKVKRVIVGS